MVRLFTFHDQSKDASNSKILEHVTPCAFRSTKCKRALCQDMLLTKRFLVVSCKFEQVVFLRNLLLNSSLTVQV